MEEYRQGGVDNFIYLNVMRLPIKCGQPGGDIVIDCAERKRAPPGIY